MSYLRRWLSANRIRFIVRASFLALLLATVLLPYATLNVQKERNAAAHGEKREVAMQRIIDRLLSPEGQLALSNPERISAKSPVPLRPVVLPFSELQADAPLAVLDQLRTVGCPVQFRSRKQDQGSVCVGVRKGDAHDVRGRLFIAGDFVSKQLVPHVSSELEPGRTIARRIQDSHRIRIDLSDGKSLHRWTLPVQVRIDEKTRQPSGLGLTAYKLDDQGLPLTQRPDFTGGWLVEGECSQADEAPETCLRTSTFSIAVPRNTWRTPGLEAQRVNPGDLTVRVIVSAPSVDGKPVTLLDSGNTGTAVTPFVVSDLENHLLPGEAVTVQRLANGKPQGVFTLSRASGGSQQLQSLGERVLGWIPGSVAVGDANREFTVRDGSSFSLQYKASPQGLDPDLVQSSARLAAYAGFMASAVLVAWVAIEVGLVVPILRMTRRTRKVSTAVHKEGELDRFDFSDLRGADELGTLASGIDDLLNRIGDDVRREAIRVEHQKSVLQAIGHEIRSPLQALSFIYGESDQGKPYIKRMFRAIDALYGSSSPSEGIEGVDVEVQELDLVAFLSAVAKNAPHAGIDNVVFVAEPAESVKVKCDPAALEDTVSHILNNAARYRLAGTAIGIGLTTRENIAIVSIHNHGKHIPGHLLDRIFEYGVSDRANSADGNRGQGLFVARTYLSKMGGSIAAHNRSDGVEVVIELPATPVESARP